MTILSTAQKAARTRAQHQAERARKLSEAGFKAAAKRRHRSAFHDAHDAEAKSKRALRQRCQKHGWKLAFFEGPTGAPRTGIIDAIAWKLGRRNADQLDLQLIQLKGGNSGVSGREVARLKKAALGVSVKWLIAEHDGKNLQLLPGDPFT